MAVMNSSAPPFSNVIAGKVLHKESRLGIPDLLVEVFDLSQWADPESGGSPAVGPDATSIARDPLSFVGGDISNLYKVGQRIGSALTQSAGDFVIQLVPRDFSAPRKVEQKPDLVLLVLAPDEPGLSNQKRLLHFSMDVRFNAGTSEAYVILLSSALLTERGVPFGEPKREDPQISRQRMAAYIDERTREQEFNTGAASHHGAEAARDGESRRTFREAFIKKMAADFTSVPLRGVIAGPNDSIKDRNSTTVQRGIAAANSVLDAPDIGGVPINLYLTSADLGHLASFFAGATGAFVDIPDAEIRDLLFRVNSAETPGTLLIHNNPIANFCAAESADEKCAKKHTGIAPQPQNPPSPDPAVPGADAITDDDVLTYLDRLVRDMPAADVVLRPELAEKRKDEDIEAAVKAFSLQKGPAEVPAFHDVYSIQIAFEHVWRQLFDEEIPNLAYTANALGKARFGIDGVVDRAIVNGALTANAFFTVTPVDVPTIVARFFDITREEFNEMPFATRQHLVYIANQIDECTVRTLFMGSGTFTHTGSKITDLRMIQSLTEQGERLIDSVRHDEYYTLHKTLRDLHARLSGKYEFTVFAADKDHHSVNFGLMNTYRQQWTPLNYQAGRLLKTIPLAPKEERKYALKTTRRDKRSTKEARKNNSSLTNEQSSTSRVEADIMAKVQNKTTFGMSTEGDFKLGVYDGKGKTNFGVDAVSDSAQNRKDFREAVRKAVQDYKAETASEVVGELDFTAESTESGTLVNPNDELAVTYLFYELQKRYRLSEQIYRVMPVVLVAQPVPSPDQITPAWIIAHDWMLNRHLLDDSFRPALSYLTSNSVGDDFSLRELRKNLRQQRNLVETLRIEFSAASQQANNRYSALESLISRRIAAEEAEAGDGLLNDVADFIGRGPVISSFFGSGAGPNPEAAKARELAAKDAHQYALEKAEKAGAALKQETNALHELTERYNKTLQARLDNETMVKRLLVHIRNNILYYMQAIWSLEPPDQRYLRLHNVPVPVLELESRTFRVKVEPDLDIFAAFREPGTERHRAFMRGKLKQMPGTGFATKPLVEVADLGTVVCCVGNYMAFALKEHNALTEFMSAPYIDAAFGAMDPDELSNVSLDEYSEYICCLRRTKSEEQFNAIKDELTAWLRKLMATPLRQGDEIVVPTGSLFIESLVDPNPILEVFKMKHRELDVYKVQEEVRKAGLENLRLASRLLHAEREDPDIEKKIVIKGAGVDPNIDVDN